MLTLDDLVCKLQKFGKHLAAIERSENDCLNFEGSTGIFLAYEQWTSAETTGGIQMAWSHDQCCKIKKHTPGSPTSFSNSIKGVSRSHMDIV